MNGPKSTKQNGYRLKLQSKACTSLISCKPDGIKPVDFFSFIKKVKGAFL